MLHCGPTVALICFWLFLPLSSLVFRGPCQSGHQTLISGIQSICSSLSLALVSFFVEGLWPVCHSQLRWIHGSMHSCKDILGLAPASLLLPSSPQNDVSETSGVLSGLAPLPQTTRSRFIGWRDHFLAYLTPSSSRQVLKVKSCEAQGPESWLNGPKHWLGRACPRFGVPSLATQGASDIAGNDN